ncbi:lipid-binding SYLF domain-containing protein [Campylobacter mucosalis]|uniref:lipid-binding SYLF domain-containing protein n=1 Tax=Campylobacter mucosalis TaxID=202 RepID=UPI0014702CB6|nr:lipid-binding SYLF domain-containing protein [Campylobacter mucosalis]
MRKILVLFLFIAGLFAEEEVVLNSANAYINTIRANQNLPVDALLKRSYAIVIFPSVKKVGFVFSGMVGDGIMVISPKSSNPELVPVKISGGSFGLQVGYEDSSLLFFILKESMINDIQNSKFTIQADASFSFGDGGRVYHRSSDFKFSSDIYAYATNSGFFAGASFGGAIISPRDENMLHSGYAYEQLQKALLKF